jgi:hypothetical protein
MNEAMYSEFTAIVERDGPLYIAYCAEVPAPTAKGNRVKSA